MDLITTFVMSNDSATSDMNNIIDIAIAADFYKGLRP